MCRVSLVWVKRKSMSPGTVFIYHTKNFYAGTVLLVVLDATSEVGFWDGSKWAMGDAGPGLFFQVVS